MAFWVGEDGCCRLFRLAGNLLFWRSLAPGGRHGCHEPFQLRQVFVGEDQRMTYHHANALEVATLVEVVLDGLRVTPQKLGNLYRLAGVGQAALLRVLWAAGVVGCHDLA